MHLADVPHRLHQIRSRNCMCRLDNRGILVRHVMPTDLGCYMIVGENGDEQKFYNALPSGICIPGDGVLPNMYPPQTAGQDGEIVIDLQEVTRYASRCCNIE